MILSKGSLIRLNNTVKLLIPIFSYEEARQYLGKGWNYINIYDLLKFKQAYIAILTCDKGLGKKAFYAAFGKLTGNALNNRTMDEYLNALKCFSIVESYKDDFKIISSLNFDVERPFELYACDKDAIRGLYFSYIRFKYFHNWFLGNIEDKSQILKVSEEHILNKSFPVFSFSDKLYFDNERNQKKKSRKLIDSYFYFSPVEYHQFDSKDEMESREEKALMRFWDVYIEWGKKLNLVEKINISQALGVDVYTTDNKNVYVNYFTNDAAEINLKEFIEKFYPSSTASISIPELTINLAIHFRCSIKKIHEEIINQSANSNHLYSLQRTSAIFIRGKEFIYPKVGNAFVSHIYIR